MAKSRAALFPALCALLALAGIQCRLHVYPYPAPGAPAAADLVVGDTQIRASWAAVSEATSYAVYYGTIDDPSTALTFGGDVSGTAATITGLVNGTPYYVWLTAKNEGGSSPFSPSASATPRAAHAALGSGAVTVSGFNGTNIYSIVSPQPAGTPESNAAATTSYSYAIKSMSGSMAPPQRSAAPGTLAPIPNITHALPYGGTQREVDLRMRETEETLLAAGSPQLSRAPAGVEAAAPYPISVGTTWSGVYITVTGGTIDTTCRYISGHAYFFVDDRDTALMAPLLAGYGTAFDAIYGVNHTNFGEENDVDGNGKVIIIFSEELIDDSPSLLGYFYAVDKYPKATYAQSNEGDIFYITTNATYQGDTILGTLAHEFQHMIYFDEHYNRGVTSTYAWLNEALSQAAEYVNDYLDNHLGWIWWFLYEDWQSGLSLTHWTSANYGYGAIFIRYLIDQYGETAIRNMCATNLVGVAAVEAATGDDFNAIFNNFTRALVMSGTGDTPNPAYGFATLDLVALQTGGRGGLYIDDARSAGSTWAGSLSPYSLAATEWTGTFGTMNLTGSAGIAGTAFGLSR